MAWVEHVHADIDALVASVTADLHAACADAIATRGGALLALAGGRTPLPIYQALATRALCWPKVSVMPTDERCVPHDHPACNLREINDAFSGATGIRVEALTTRDGDPQASVTHARGLMARHPDPFDAVVLGMGTDAHTASLFPGAAALSEALDPLSTLDACRIDPDPLPPEAPFPRITLTAARLLRARALHLVITGAAKREVLRRAQASRDVLRHPIGAVLHARGAVTYVHWSP